MDPECHIFCIFPILLKLLSRMPQVHSSGLLLSYQFETEWVDGCHQSTVTAHAYHESIFLGSYMIQHSWQKQPLQMHCNGIQMSSAGCRLDKWCTTPFCIIAPLRSVNLTLGMRPSRLPVTLGSTSQVRTNPFDGKGETGTHTFDPLNNESEFSLWTMASHISRLLSNKSSPNHRWWLPETWLFP